MELSVGAQLCDLCDTPGTSVGSAYSIFSLTELHITPLSAVNKELAYFYHHIRKLDELATILILRHSQN